MSRTQKFFYNSISTAVYQLAVMLVGFVTPRVILQFYGSQLNGLVSSVSQFITYLSLVEAGIAGAAVYALYKPLADNDNAAVSSVLSAARRFYFQAGWLFTGLITVMAAVYPLFVRTDALSSVAVALLVIVLGAKSFLEFFTLAKYRVILTADQKTYVVSNASSLYVILQMLIIVVLSALYMNIVIVYAAAIIALLARSVILMLYVKRHYPYINYTAKPDTKALNKRWDALFLQLLGAAQSGAPVIIATVFTSLTDVSVYSVYNMVFAGIGGVLNIFVNGLSAGFGDVIARKQKDTLRKSYKEFEYAYYILITVVYTVTFIMLLSFVDIYTKGITDADYHRPLTAALFTVNGLLFNLKTPQGMLVISAGMYKETRYRTLTQALIIIVVGAALAKPLGLVGILIASCLSNIYRDIDLLFFIPKRVTHLPVRASALGMLRSVLIFSALCAVSYLVPLANGMAVWILQALLVTAAVTLVTLAVNYIAAPNLFKSVVTRVKTIITKK